MSSIGNIDLWADQFPDDQIPEIIQLIVNSWDCFQAPRNLHEVPITRLFRAHLRNNKNRSTHYFRIEWESTELDESGQETGRIDLKFTQGLIENVYFSIECKRLRVTFPSGRFSTIADKYVTDGMCRYFNEQYAQGLDKGGMLGYVMDGNTNEAIQDVTQAIERHRSDLYMPENEAIRRSLILTNDRVKETHHNYGSEGHFTLHHIFLPVQQPGDN
jgi:hypothetical protein